MDFRLPPKNPLTSVMGSVNGGMTGVYYGYDAVPDRWKEKILVKEQLISIAKRIIKGNGIDNSH
ncbi:MAG TPA: hypothetical protein GXX36_00005 [Clostridiaceae bacterium]|nr:hypothetical protein [Clostridiaceae bacterium]